MFEHSFMLNLRVLEVSSAGAAISDRNIGVAPIPALSALTIIDNCFHGNFIAHLLVGNAPALL